MEVLLDKGERFFDIKVAQAVALADLRGSGGADKAVNKQIEVPDQMKGRFLLVVYDVEHLVFHGLGNVFMACLVDRLIGGQPGKLHRFSGAQSVKFDPHIFPGDIVIRYVSTDLVREDHKALAALYLMGDRFAMGVVGVQDARTRETVVKHASGNMTDYQDHYYPSEMSVDALLQTFLIEKDKDAFLKNFDMSWQRYNRDIIRMVQEYEAAHGSAQ